MSGVTKKLMSASGGVAGFTAIEDVFSTYLYTGNGSTQTITNGIDLAGEGGLVWTKNRDNAFNHFLYDTERGVSNYLISDITIDQQTVANSLTAFNSDGFTLGSNDYGNITSGAKAVSWTFRKAPRFFDVVTYTGDGVAGREIPHNLGTTVGTLIVKKTSTADNWQVYHRGVDATAPEDYHLELNGTNERDPTGNRWNGTAPTDSVFTVSSSSSVNQSGQTYVAYLFAHDPLGPSGDGSDGLIDCGTCSGETGANRDIDLGWEPQWVLTKAADTTGDWRIVDNMRGFLASGTGVSLAANTSNAESADDTIHVRSTGFYVNGLPGSGNYIYIAIRRGPMRAPESGTEVFATTQWVGDGIDGRVIDTSITLDASILTARGEAWDRFSNTRLTGNNSLYTNSTAAQATQGIQDFGKGQTKVSLYSSFANFGSRDYILWGLKRAPNFFDVVAYNGNGVTGRTVPHNLGVVPELVVVKLRNGDLGWATYSAPTGVASKGFLNDASAFSSDDGSYWNLTTPTDNEITLGSVFDVNGGTGSYVAYLFATLAGVSKVGSYTGNGSSQTINCGFTTGARFILIKRTDAAGDWYVWDTARGIVTGNDPFLELNTTDAEVTSDDSIDPDSSGFIVNQTATTNVNVNAASYIFYAIA